MGPFEPELAVSPLRRQSPLGSLDQHTGPDPDGAQDVPESITALWRDTTARAIDIDRPRLGLGVCFGTLWHLIVGRP